MLDHALRLAVALNQLASAELNAAEAEHRIRTRRQVPHHVLDADQLLGLDPVSQVPLRLALARLAHRDPSRGAPVWALLLPRPGRMAGLRGPLPVNQAALEAEAVVMTHDGTLAWLGREVGAGVQWRLARAERPVPPPDPREAARAFAGTVAASSQALDGLDLVAGTRPDEVHAPVLGSGYPASSQALLDRSWLVLAACDQALEAQHEVLHSHAVLTRERHLRELAGAALDAVAAAVSWPERALEG